MISLPLSANTLAEIEGAINNYAYYGMCPPSGTYALPKIENYCPRTEYGYKVACSTEFYRIQNAIIDYNKIVRQCH